MHQFLSLVTCGSFFLACTYSKMSFEEIYDLAQLSFFFQNVGGGLGYLPGAPTEFFVLFLPTCGLFVDSSCNFVNTG